MSKSSVRTTLPIFRTAYDNLDTMVTIATAYYNLDENGVYDPGLTLQSEREEADINNIIARYETTQMIALRRDADKADFKDLSNAPTYQEALNIVAKANETFAELPATIRERFLNDPARFLDFVSNPANTDEMVKLGLAEPKPPTPTPEPISVRVVEPATPPATKAEKPS